jgi:hypothetical protein
MRRALLIVAAICLPALADDFPRREIFGVVGIGKTYDDEGSLGSGINGGGGAGYRLSRRFGVEAEVNAFRTTREFASSLPSFAAHGAHVTGSGLVYFGRSKANPYLIFGAGLLHITNTMDFGGIARNQSADGLSVNIGFGLKIFVSRHLALRPEFRLYTGGGSPAVEAPFGDARLSMGLGYHW